MRKVILAWKTAHFLSFTYFLFMKKSRTSGEKSQIREYVPGGSKSKCVSAEADKSVWPGSRKFRNAFQNGTNLFLKVFTFLFSWTIFENTFLISLTCTVYTLEGLMHIKAELPLESIFLALNFLPWELVKKLEIKKTKTTKYTTFKTEIIKVVLVFFYFQLFYKWKFPGKKIECGL